MTNEDSLDLVCVSYLAHATVLCVPTYPDDNAGIVCDGTVSSLGADGPLAALAAARSGLRVGLVANPVGTDTVAHELTTVLDTAGIDHHVEHVASIDTPHLYVVAHETSTSRVWFLHAPAQTLEPCARAWTMLHRARMVHVDCHAIPPGVAVRAIRRADPSSALMLNLGNEGITEDIRTAAKGRRVVFVRDRAHLDVVGHAEDHAEELYDTFRPSGAAIVTLGARGAVVRSGDGYHQVPAPCPATVWHDYGAGAVLCGTLASCWLADSGVHPAVATWIACVAATAHCESGTPTPIPQTLPQ